MSLFLSLSPMLRAGERTDNESEATPPTQPFEDNTPGRLLSLILCLDAPRQINSDAIADAIGKALDQKVGAAQLESKPPYYIVKLAAGKFVIRSADKPYLEDAEKVARVTDDPQMADAIRRAKAWIAVNWIRGEDKTDLDRAYQYLGKVVAALADEHTLVIYDPDLRQMRLFNPDLKPALTSEHPLQIFEHGADTAKHQH